MWLFGYLFGIRSERRWVEEVPLNLAYRWFCRRGWEGVVPERSTFSKHRYGRSRDSGLLRMLFEEVIQRCIEAQLVPAEHFAVNSSTMIANANPDRRLEGKSACQALRDRPRQPRPVRDYLEALDAESSDLHGTRSFVPK